MKQFLITMTSVFLFPLTVLATELQVIDIDIEGMSCKFCAYSVQKKMTKLPYVNKAEVNIETKKAHIEITEGKIFNLEELKQKVIDSGFKPVKVTLSSSH